VLGRTRALFCVGRGRRDPRGRGVVDVGKPTKKTVARRHRRLPPESLHRAGDDRRRPLGARPPSRRVKRVSEVTCCFIEPHRRADRQRRRADLIEDLVPVGTVEASNRPAARTGKGGGGKRDVRRTAAAPDARFEGQMTGRPELRRMRRVRRIGQAVTGGRSPVVPAACRARPLPTEICDLSGAQGRRARGKETT